MKKIACILLLLVMVAQAVTIHALNWNLSNATANSDVRLRWTGTALPPRYPLTIMYKYRPRQQLGFYATFWYTAATEAFNGKSYYNGGLPYPPGGGGGSGGGSTHTWEVAHDGTDTQSPQNVVTGVWYPQAFVSSLDGSNNLNYTYYWAVDSGTTSTWIVTAQTPANNLNGTLGSCVCTATAADGGAYILELGGSPWEANFGGNTGQNDETLSGWIRDIQIFDTTLSASDIATEMATESNAAVTAVGGRHLWYSNLDPIPTDVTDKSGAGHNPAWANTNRPIQFDSTFGSSVTSYRALLGVGN